MVEIDNIEDVANHRAITVAVSARPGCIAVENIAGVLKRIDDQGVATVLGLSLYEYAAGPNMPDADTSITPAQDQYSLITVPATVTAPRILTILNTGATALRESLRIVNKSASAITVKNAAGTTIATIPAAIGGTPAKYYYTDTFFSTNYILNVSGFVNAS